MISRPILAALKQSICAIGCLKVPVAEYAANPFDPNLLVVGTGFLVRHNAVLTVRHVVHKAMLVASSLSIPDEQRVLVFFQADGARVESSIYSWGHFGWLHEPLQDLALVRFVESDPARAERFKAVSVVDAFCAEVGDPVAVLGYPFGHAGLIKQDTDGKERIYRIGPVTQQGYVSAIAPYDESERIDRLLLDVRTTQGMSGAPVVDATSGIVYGIHDRGSEATLAFAIPIDAARVRALLTVADAVAPKERGQTAQVGIEVPEVFRKAPKGSAT